MKNPIPTLVLILTGCLEQVPHAPDRPRSEQRTVPNLSPENLLEGTELEENDRFGYVIDGGDINGDGYADALIGSIYYQDSRGAAFVFYGSSTGLSSSSQRLMGTGATASSKTNSGAGVGGKSNVVADLDDDGYDEVILNSYQSVDGYYVGAAYIFQGTVTGAGEETVLWPVEYGFHQSFTTAMDAGDTDGDGYNDLLVTRYRDVDNIGGSYLYLGSATGLSSLPEAYYGNPSGSDGDNYGADAACVGDANGDGLDDMVVGASQAFNHFGQNDGVVYYHEGSPDGLEEAVAIAPPNGSVRAFGIDLDNARDVNGDGYGDLIVGGPDSSEVASYGGSAFVYFGSLSGLDEDNYHQLENDKIGRFSVFGNNTGGVGDIDGDGFDDVTVSIGVGYGTRVFLYFGAASGISSSTLFLEPPSDESEFAGFGHNLGYIGDTNADGYDDLMIGMVSYNEDAGAAYYYLGAPEDGDGDGVGIAEDCDDTDASVGAEAAHYRDNDGDGYGADSEASVQCPSEGWSLSPDDCDDTDATISPGADEVCGDGIDQDCDGVGLPGDDEDGDGLSSEAEDAIGTEPCEPDSDGDGLSDGDEVNGYGTDPLDEDTDGDGITDGEEVADGTDPLVAEADEDTASPQDSGTPDEEPRCGCVVADAPGAAWVWVMAAVLIAQIRRKTSPFPTSPKRHLRP